MSDTASMIYFTALLIYRIMPKIKPWALWNLEWLVASPLSITCPYGSNTELLCWQVFTIEPVSLHVLLYTYDKVKPLSLLCAQMINLGRVGEVHWPDNWTATTVDGKRSAQFEETLLWVFFELFGSPSVWTTYLCDSGTELRKLGSRCLLLDQS